MARKLITLIILAVAGYYAYGYFMSPNMVGGSQMGGAMPVSVAKVIERKVQTWQEFSGRLVAVDAAEIRPQVSGTIDSIHFEDGAMVKKGDLLFVIDPRPYAAAMQSAKARAELANSEWKRAETLFAEKAISKRDYDQRKNAALVAKADATRAQLDLNYTHVKAPIDGRVSRAEITVGNLVGAGPNAPLLTTVVSSHPIYADFELDETSYLKYARAQATGEDAQELPVTMELAADGQTRQGKVESFDNKLDVLSGTIRVRAVFDNEDGVLVPGLFASVRLGGAGEKKAVLITDRAVGTDQNNKFVIVVGEGGVTERRQVTLGGMAEGLRIVEEGLKPGEQIVVSGLQRIMMPGQPVLPELVPMDGSEAPAQKTMEQTPPATKAPEEKSGAAPVKAKE